MPRTVGQTLLCSPLSKKILIVSSLLLGACVTTRPNVDLVLAREAFNAASEVDAAKYSPANYHKAEEAYRKAMLAYTNRDYDEAIENFKLARTYSERAENSSRAQRQKVGEEAL